MDALKGRLDVGLKTRMMLHHRRDHTEPRIQKGMDALKGRLDVQHLGRRDRGVAANLDGGGGGGGLSKKVAVFTTDDVNM